MARMLTTYVHAVEVLPDGSYGRQAMFGPTDGVPEWARRAITNPDVWAGEPDPDDDSDVDLDPPSRAALDRPRGNASRDVWAAYGVSQGVDLTEGMTRDEIVAAVDRDH